MLFTWLRNFGGRKARVMAGRQGPSPARRARFRPHLEGLEERLVLNNTDISIVGQSNLNPVQVGKTLTYTFTITNNGPQDNNGGATFTDTLPSTVTITSATIQSSYATQADVHLSGNTITINLHYLGSTTGGGVPDIVTIKVTPNATGELDNTASVDVGPGNTDPNPGNNQVTVTNLVTSGPVTANQAWVAQAYRDLLFREADMGGLNFYSSQLDNGASRFQVALALQASSEYRTALIQQDYLNLLQRNVDPQGLNFYLNFMAAGGTSDQVFASIVGSPEYYQTRAGQDPNGWFAAAYSDILQRSPDANGQRFFSLQLVKGATHAQVALQMLVSSEGAQIEIQSDYQQFLGRAADPNGLDFYTKAITSNPSASAAGFTTEDVIAAILASPEYAAKLSF
jgi:uncharacterized repeat protein (TIGR01451 family)